MICNSQGEGYGDGEGQQVLVGESEWIRMTANQVPQGHGDLQYNQEDFEAFDICAGIALLMHSTGQSMVAKIAIRRTLQTRPQPNWCNFQCFLEAILLICIPSYTET